MKHLDQFSIHSFRGLQDVDFAALGQINLLIGGNNTGKTSVLEALSLFSDPLNWRKWHATASAREVSAGLVRPGVSSRLNLNDRLMWLFPHWQGVDDTESMEPASISFSATGDFMIEKVSAAYEKFSELRRPRSRLPRSEELNVEDNDVEVEGIKILISAWLRPVQLMLPGIVQTPIQGTVVFSEDQPLPTTTGNKVSALPVQLINPFSHRLQTYRYSHGRRLLMRAWRM